jgi:hypothetical protein
MAVPADGSSGILRGHGVAFALAAIFGGMALVVGYAASNGAIFGMGGEPEAAGGAPAERIEPSVTSSDSFEGSVNAPAQDMTETPTQESSTALTEDQRELLAMSDFAWDSVAREYFSDEDLMNRFKEPVSAEPGTEPLSVLDTIVVEISQDRSIEDTLEEVESVDIDDMDIPIESAEEDEQPEQDEEDQNDGEDNGANEEDPNEGSGSNSGPGNGNDQSGTGGDSGNGNSTDIEEPPTDSDSGDDNSTSIEGTPTG